MYNELQELSSLVTSNEWRSFLSMLDEHKDFLQKQVNTFIRSQDLISAYGALSKLDDIDNILTLVSKRISDLKKRSE